ncbi:uncharacterized protein SAPINGB_P001055 [Magnusiomyces paraingens]|uniref:Uncharacterized protein n=1 Tax=Magnusiomyces paraingens TaxID=2606893 RepID=A0A5E8B3S0_9ASCO|nr:uncharacterized protein SAPINGB_P001055 [Saprochaete ingens]VVT46118.1 unnamed protein product [Saprochaete ingens]
MSKYMNSLPFEQQEQHWAILNTMVPAEQERYFKDLDKKYESTCRTEYTPKVTVSPQSGLRQKLYEAVLKMEQEEEERKRQEILKHVEVLCATSMIVSSDTENMTSQGYFYEKKEPENGENQNSFPLDNNTDDVMLKYKDQDQRLEINNTYCIIHNSSLESDEWKPSVVSSVTTMESLESFNSEPELFTESPKKKHQIRSKLKNLFKLSLK